MANRRWLNTGLAVLLGFAMQQGVRLPSGHLSAIMSGPGSVLHADTYTEEVPDTANAIVSNTGPQQLDTNAYLVELDRWAAAAQRLQSHPGEAAALEKDLPRCWNVTMRGQTFRVSTEWLRRALDSLRFNRAPAADYSKEIRDRLDGMRSGVQNFEREPAVEPAAARGKLQQILQGRDFQEAPAPTGWDRFRDRIAYWIQDLIARILGRLGNHPVAYRGLAWTIAIGLVSGSMLWLFRILVARGPGTRLELHGAIHVPRSWRDWAREALSASARGDYREALHLAYWAGIYRLEEHGVWQVDRARTPREYLRLLPVGPGLNGGSESEARVASRPDRSAFAAITSRFERVWYGGHAASAEDFQAMVSELEIVGCPLPSILPTGRS